MNAEEFYLKSITQIDYDDVPHRKILVDIITANLHADGIKIQSGVTTVGWDGMGTLAVDQYPHLTDLAHEYAHYVTTPASKIFTPEFGLGYGFSTLILPPNTKIAHEKVCEYYEALACIYSFCMMYHNGVNASYQASLVAFDSYSDSIQLAVKCIKSLQNRNLLDHNFAPTWKTFHNKKFN